MLSLNLYTIISTVGNNRKAARALLKRKRDFVTMRKLFKVRDSKELPERYKVLIDIIAKNSDLAGGANRAANAEMQARTAWELNRATNALARATWILSAATITLCLITWFG